MAKLGTKRRGSTSKRRGSTASVKHDVEEKPETPRKILGPPLKKETLINVVDE